MGRGVFILSLELGGQSIRLAGVEIFWIFSQIFGIFLRYLDLFPDFSQFFGIFLRFLGFFPDFCDFP